METQPFITFETYEYEEPVRAEYNRINVDIANKSVKSIPKEIYKLEKLEKFVAWENLIRYGYIHTYPSNYIKFKSTESFKFLLY